MFQGLLSARGLLETFVGCYTHPKGTSFPVNIPYDRRNVDFSSIANVCPFTAADGIEDLRRSCGGHGFLMSSGIAPLEADFKGPNTTAEGDFVLLSLQTSRFLLKSMAAAKRGEPLSGLTQCLEPFKDPGFDPHSQGREVLNLAHATTVEEFLNPDYLVKLFELRTLTAIHKAYSAVQRSVDSGKSQDEARNASARLLYTTTKSHVRYFIISKFAINITTVQDQPCKAVLVKLCALFAVADLLEGEQWIGLLNAQVGVHLSMREASLNMTFRKLICWRKRRISCAAS